MPGETSITPYPDGPLIVRGDVTFLDESGAEIRQPRRTVALCRCGASAIKPWCDGTHKLVGFSTPARVLPRAQEGTAGSTLDP